MTPNFDPTAVKRLIGAAERLLANAIDRDEVEDEHGNMFRDWKSLEREIARTRNSFQ